MNKKLFFTIILTGLTIGLEMSLSLNTVMAANNSTFSQTINDGTQSVDIVDGTGTTVASPAVNFTTATSDFAAQTITGILGSASQKIRVYNPTADASWSITMAATGGPTATWSDGTNSYDFNDSNTDGSDDGDTDALGGQLTINPSSGTITGIPDSTSCPNTGVSLGTDTAYREIATAVNSVTLLSGDASAQTYCRWDLTGIGVSQIIPGSQPAGNYNLNFTITIA